MPFQQTSLAVRTGDGRNVTLLESLTYVSAAGETIIVPAGAQSDGTSTPPEIWPWLPPFGKYWLAAVLHDFLYRDSARAKADCDDLFLEAMTSLGVGLETRTAIYEGVKFGGTIAFDDDRKKAIALEKNL